MTRPKHIGFRRCFVLVQFYWTTIENGRIEDLLEFCEVNVFLFSGGRRHTPFVPTTMEKLSANTSMLQMSSLHPIVDLQRTIVGEGRGTISFGPVRRRWMIVGQRIIDLRARYQQATILPLLPRLNTRRRSKRLNHWRKDERRTLVDSQVSQSTHARCWVSRFPKQSTIRARRVSNHVCSMMISSVKEIKWEMMRPFVFFAILCLAANENAKNESSKHRKSRRALFSLSFSVRLGIVTIPEDTRGFIRTNFNQQFIIWPCKYDPQAILSIALDQTLSYVQKQDRSKWESSRIEAHCSSRLVDESDPMALAMFTKTLAIIDCLSTLICIQPDCFDRFESLALRIIYLLPG